MTFIRKMTVAAIVGTIVDGDGGRKVAGSGRRQRVGDSSGDNFVK